MALFEIRNRFSGDLIFSLECDSMAACVKAAITSGDSLSNADFSDADLSGVDFCGVKGLPEIPIVKDIDAAILAACTSPGCKLNMRAWHTCGTSHCRAGWAIFLAGDSGKVLEDHVGPAAAGALIYTVSRPGKPVPPFYANQDEAMADIIECAKASMSPG